MNIKSVRKNTFYLVILKLFNLGFTKNRAAMNVSTEGYIHFYFGGYIFESESARSLL